jgi:hypothetical protein
MYCMTSLCKGVGVEDVLHYQVVQLLGTILHYVLYDPCHSPLCTPWPLPFSSMNSMTSMCTGGGEEDVLHYQVAHLSVSPANFILHYVLHNPCHSPLYTVLYDLSVYRWRGGGCPPLLGSSPVSQPWEHYPPLCTPWSLPFSIMYSMPSLCTGGGEEDVLHF